MRVRERRHDSAVAEAAAAFRGVGIPVAAGWRWVVSWNDGQLVPDLWVQLPVPGREEGIWVAVEVEFSAKTKAAHRGKVPLLPLGPDPAEHDVPRIGDHRRVVACEALR